MLPQHGGVPNYRMRVPVPAMLLLALVLLTGGMIALSFHMYSDDGDIATKNNIMLTLMITGVVSVLILMVATSRFWHPHLWQTGISRRRHHRHKQNHRSRTSRTVAR